jgi:predicted amidohydrolase YtcJ
MTDTVFTNGNIITFDETNPLAEALVIRGDRIAYVGSVDGSADCRTFDAQVIDLQGKTLIPGFNDNHLHVLAMGDYFSKLNLQQLSCEQVVDKLRSLDPSPRPREPMYASGWDYPDCPTPHRALLDAHFPNRPVALFQYSGHAAWVNTAFLRKLKVTGRTPDPPGGMIEKDADGAPTGILKDKAVMPIHFKRFWQMNTRAKLRAMLCEKAMGLFRENGITSVQDNTWFPFTVSHYNRLKKHGKLPVRITCWSYGELPWARFWLEHKPFDAIWVRKGPRKFFLDGTFSTRTAMLMHSYQGEAENFGLPAISAERLRLEIQRAVRQRRQLALHAIGDRAIHQFLDVLELFEAEKPQIRALRFRLEHAQLIAPEDLQRLAEWGVLLAVQPSALNDSQKDRQLLGAERAEGAYPYRSILRQGIPLSFGSDVPGESRFKPLELIHLVVNRPSRERISAFEALAAYTKGSAYAEFMEKEKGTLTAGKLADCVVLSDDPTRCPPERIRDIRVERTVVGGQTVFAA